MVAEREKKQTNNKTIIYMLSRVKIGPHLPVIAKIKVAGFYGPQCISKPVQNVDSFIS